MARRKKPAKKAGGPYLAAAVFCERVIEDKPDSAMSAIRIVDRVTVQVPPDFPPGERVPVSLMALVSLKSGDAKGDYVARLFLNTPTGRREKVAEMSVPLQGEEHGASIRLAVMMGVKTEGLYWVDVVLNRRRFTRMPLRISIQRVRAEPSDERRAAKGIE